MAEIVLDRDTRLDSRDDLAPTAAIQVSEIREVAIPHTQRITVRFACCYANEISTLRLASRHTIRRR